MSATWPSIAANLGRSVQAVRERWETLKRRRLNSVSPRAISISELEVVVFMKTRNLFEWRVFDARGETLDSGHSVTVAEARLAGCAARRRDRLSVIGSTFDENPASNFKEG